MIIANLLGGLGNQMFQYAAGRALSIHLNQPLRLDVSGFANYRLHHGFELSRLFAGYMEVASSEDMQKVLSWRAPPMFRRLLLRKALTAFRGKQFVVEPHFKYWNGINHVPLNAYLAGYWQSEKYFKNIEHSIRTDFVFKLPMSDNNEATAEEIEQCNSVSLHVRRGDYVQNANVLSVHALCSIEYYRMAIRQIAERVQQPVFFIFSDDIAWVKDNLKIDFPCRFVDHNHGTESFNDMRLMSLCRHHIIANSSFSWWGAWLAQGGDQNVFYPKNWFNNPSYDISDLVPESWIPIGLPLFQ
jgi:hypothetical protein